MLRSFTSQTDPPQGKIDFVEQDPKVFQVYFTPPQEALTNPREDPAFYRTRIMILNYPDQTLTFEPFKVGGFQNMSPRYSTLKHIQVEISERSFPKSESDIDLDYLIQDSFPDIFTINYHWGLGFMKVYRPIASTLEQQSIKKLIVANFGNSTIDLKEQIATITWSDLRAMKATIVKINARAQRVAASLKKQALNKQVQHLILNQPLVPDTDVGTTNNLRDAMLSLENITRGDRRNAIKVLSENTRKMVQEAPAQLLKLRNDIELVSLEELIGKMDLMLTKSLTEKHWQRLLEENPFILQMAFSIPVLKVQSQAFVGGRKISGSGEKIADFIVKNTGTNNTAIVEIKTPSLKLLNQKEYRGGVFGPSTEIVSSMNQLLDQIYHFQREIGRLKENTRQYDLESYSVAGILIAGRSVTRVDEQKSLEHFRGNSKLIQVITFDELLDKLKSLHEFLKAKEPLKPLDSVLNDSKNEDEDLPF